MELSAVLLARVIGFVETNDLNPRGKLSFPMLVPLIVNKFNFQKYPQEAKDFDEQKGVEFIEGHTGDTSIDKLVVWYNGIQLDVRSSTDEARKIIDSTLSWLKKEAGLNYSPSMIKRWAYLSQVTFYSEVDLDSAHAAIARLSMSVTKIVSEINQMELQFKPTGLTWSFDRTMKQVPVASFLIQRRADTPFSEGKYFSEAPLPTDAHIKLLEQFESDLLTK